MPNNQTFLSPGPHRIAERVRNLSTAKRGGAYSEIDGLSIGARSSSFEDFELGGRIAENPLKDSDTTVRMAGRPVSGQLDPVVTVIPYGRRFIYPVSD